MKRLVIILGMRSGSSLTAHISQSMGAYLGEADELMGAALGNPDGHYENMEAVAVNNRILHFCGREWYSLEAPMPDYKDFKIIKEMENIKAVVCRLLEKSDMAVIKDPRICLLLPLWDRALKELEVEVRYIWVFRNPLEIMESLRKRDGYSSRHGLLLWIHYNLSVLKYLQGKDYLLINYKDILEQSQALEKLSKLFNCRFDDTLQQKLKRIIKRGYCHSDYSYEDVRNTQNELLSDLYGALLKNQESEADVLEWENRYKTAAANAEEDFMDYEVLENIRCLEGKEIVIYGAGNYGKRAAEMLQKLNYHKFDFCDRDFHKHGTNFMGGSVFSIAEIEKKKNLLIIIAIENKEWKKEIEQTLACIEDAEHLSFFALELLYKYSIVDLETLRSKVSALGEWYNELGLRANHVKCACSSPVWVYQNGKVGSSTIVKSLQNAGVENAHIHRFFFKRDIVGELILGEEETEFLKNSNVFTLHNSEYTELLKNEVKGRKIITMVREPIAVDLSTVFQWIGSGTADRFFAQRIKEGKDFQQIVFELMVKIQNRQFEWFEDELKELCGVDIYSYPFDKEKGYTVISANEVEILLLKVEKFSELTNVIRDFTGNSHLELLNDNVGKNKEYAHLYQDMKENIKLSKEYVEHYYNHHPYIEHFYTEEEQKEFLSKWKGKILNNA
ncbi:putative capsular polysaccharide synthesis family protein [Candidatus Merdisoma sp. JLR.KK011]|uniref:putative capsular polysaccharide synthesis family protein n=1 Tax=Candidatus Merdisoma sp. JLR.KK011 TaxID=3114299 RepID=UPI002FEF155B